MATREPALAPAMKPTKWLARRALNILARLITGTLCKVDADDLQAIPLEGPIILIVNHVNFLELPMIYPRIRSDLGVGFSKAENRSNPLLRMLFDNWNVLPINRDEVDVTAMRRGLQVLDEGKILFITPEGTRSHHGRLQRGKPGVVLLAQRSGAPIWPVACYGGEVFHQNLKKLRRTDYHIRVGQPFYLETNGVRVTGEVRQQIVDEMMYQMAALMPERYRGVYSDIETATETFLRFDDPQQSNLAPATIHTMSESATC